MPKPLTETEFRSERDTKDLKEDLRVVYRKLEPACIAHARADFNQRLDEMTENFFQRNIAGIARGIVEIDVGQGVSFEEAKRQWGL